MASDAPTYRILIVDDASAVREALCWAFENEPGLCVVGEASNGVEAVAQTMALQPDVVILDIELPVLDGYAVTYTLKRLSRPPIVVLLTVHSDQRSQQRGLQAGGDAFVPKSAGWAQLIVQIHEVLAAH